MYDKLGSCLVWQISGQLPRKEDLVQLLLCDDGGQSG